MAVMRRFACSVLWKRSRRIQFLYISLSSQLDGIALPAKNYAIVTGTHSRWTLSHSYVSCEEANRAETQVDNFQTEKLRKASTGLRTESSKINSD